MPHVALLLWYALILAVQFGPLAWLLARWDSRDRERDWDAVKAGKPRPRLPRAEIVRRSAIAMALLLPTFLLLTAPMYRATPALTIALGLGGGAQSRR